MALTADKQAVLDRLNREAKANYEEASERAARAGRQPPPPPVTLDASDVEYPKWLYSAKGEAKLVKTHAEHTAAGASWHDAPPKKAEAPATKGGEK